MSLSLAQIAVDHVKTGTKAVVGDSVADCSLSLIRESVRSGRPSIICINGDRFAVVGEDEDGLYLHDGNNPAFYTDDSILSSGYDGAATILIEPPPEPKKSVFIRTPENEELNENLSKSIAENIHLIDNVCSVPDSWLPSHPVILTFKSPGEFETKEKIRGMTVGPQIMIFDHNDIPSIFYHELGHVYYASRLTESEKEEIDSIHKAQAGKFPPIFQSEWWHKTPEEMFATIYMWQLKSLAIDPGYASILEKFFPIGWALLHRIHARVHGELNREAEFERRKSDLQSLLKIPVSTRVGAQLHKAIMPMKSDQPIAMPASIQYDELARHKSHSWVEILNGDFAGKIVIMRQGYIDVPFMKATSNSHLIPKKILVRSKKGKTFERTVMVNPFDVIKEDKDKRAGHLARYERGIESLKAHGKSKNQIKESIIGLGLSDIATARLLVSLDTKFPIDIETDGTEPAPKNAIESVTKIIKDNQPSYPEKKEGKENPIHTIDIDKIKPEEGGQYRKKFDRASLLILAESIAEQGLLQPIVVRPDKKDKNIYRIIGGERRWRAMNILKEQGRLPEGTMNVVIPSKDGKEITDLEKDLMQLTENYVRADPTPLETAAKLQSILDQPDDVTGKKLTIKELVNKMGGNLSDQKIRGYLLLNKLDPTLKKLLESGDLGRSMGQLLGGIEEPNKQVQVFSLAMRKGWSVKQTANYIRDIRDQGTFFNLEDTLSDKQNRAAAELEKQGGKETSGQLNQRLQKFIQNQADFVKKFLDNDGVGLSTLGAIVAGDAEKGIAQVEQIMVEMQSVLNKMKAKNQAMNEPGLFMKAQRWANQVKLNRAYQALLTEWRQVQDAFSEYAINNK